MAFMQNNKFNRSRISIEVPDFIDFLRLQKVFLNCAFGMKFAALKDTGVVVDDDDVNNKKW